MEQTKRQLKEDLQVLRIERKKTVTAKRRKPSRQRSVVWLVIICSLIAVLVLIAARGNLRERLGFSQTTVRVATATRQTSNGGAAQPVLSAGGYIIARNQVEVGSKITGRVISISVKEGDLVSQGQITARLDEAELQAEVGQAQAKLASANAQLAEVKAGSRPQQISHANLEVERLAADTKNAELRMLRSERLVREGVVAQQELDDDRARFEMAKAAQQAAKEDLSLARTGARREEVQRAQAGVEEARADLTRAQALLENTVIRAPITGMVLDRYVDVGEMVTTGFTSDRGAKQSLFTIADMTDLQVELDISEADISKVVVNQPVAMTPDAYANHKYDGVVEYIASTADKQKATVKVKVRVINPDLNLRPGMGAKVTIYPTNTSIPQTASTISLPKAALFTRGVNKVVFVVKDGVAVMQSVRTGREDGDYVEVVEGLQGGEQVVVGTEVGDGAKVVIQKQ